MRQATNKPLTTSVRGPLGLFLAVLAVAGLLAACSSTAPRAAQHTSTTVRKKVSPTSTTAPETTTTIAGPSTIYRVKSGDRLTTIARQLHISVPAIIYANHITNPDRLSEGQVLKIPAHPPVALVVTPPKGPRGQRFELDLIGAKPSEVIRFVIAAPAGKQAGPPHFASKDGTVTTRYKTSPTDRTGTYKVTVTGSKGTRTEASFVVKGP